MGLRDPHEMHNLGADLKPYRINTYKNRGRVLVIVNQKCRLVQTLVCAVPQRSASASPTSCR